MARCAVLSCSLYVLQDLDGMARCARELHDAPSSESEDETVTDDAPSRIISTCSVLLQQ